MVSGNEFFLLYDLISRHIGQSQNYSMMGYLPFPLVSAHLRFASATRHRVTFPQVHAEVRARTEKTSNLIEAMVADMAPAARAAVNKTTLVRYSIVLRAPWLTMLSERRKSNRSQ